MPGPCAPAVLWGWMGAAGEQGHAKDSANTGTRVGDDPVDSLDLCITTSPIPAPFLGKPDSHKQWFLSSVFPSMFGSPSCNSHLCHQDLCWSQSVFKSAHPYQRGSRYPIFHPQCPRRAEEHADALHKATIRDPLMEMDYNLQMIKTQLMVVGRYSRLCKGAVQMRSYQDLRSPKHLSILG